MFVDRRTIRITGSHSNGTSQPDYDSFNSSFGSTPASSGSWEQIIATPCSTPSKSSHSVRSWNMPLDVNLIDSNGGALEFSPMTALTQDMMMNQQDFQYLPTGSGNPNSGEWLQNHHNMGLDCFPRYDNCPTAAISRTRQVSVHMPSLDHDLSSPTSVSDSSPVSTSFVVPCQTFLNGFQAQSPLITHHGLDLDLQYGLSDMDFEGDDVTSFSPQSTTSLSSDYKKRSWSTSTGEISEVKPLKFEPVEDPTSDCKPEAKFSDEEDKYTKPQTRARLARKKTRSQRSKETHEIPISVHARPQEHCDWPGCDGKFHRREHLRRHERTVHLNLDGTQCLFCDKNFNRMDNLKDHVLRHSKPDRKAARTNYHPKAIIWWLQLDSKSKNRKQGTQSRSKPEVHPMKQEPKA